MLKSGLYVTKEWLQVEERKAGRNHWTNCCRQNESQYSVSKKTEW